MRTPTDPTSDACAPFRELVSARFDGEPVDERALRVHLAGCDACRGFEREVAALSERFDALRAAAPSAELRAAGLPRARAFGLARIGPARIRRFAAALSGFAAVTVGLLLLERRPLAPSPPDQPALEVPGALAGLAALAEEGVADDVHRLGDLPERELLAALRTNDRMQPALPERTR